MRNIHERQPAIYDSNARKERTKPLLDMSAPTDHIPQTPIPRTAMNSLLREIQSEKRKSTNTSKHGTRK